MKRILGAALGCCIIGASALLSFGTVAAEKKDVCNANMVIGLSSCDINYSEYKSGYEACVYDAAGWFARQYGCLPVAGEKLSYSCTDCARRFPKQPKK